MLVLLLLLFFILFVCLEGLDSDHPAKNNIEEEERVDGKELSAGDNSVPQKVVARPDRPGAGRDNAQYADPDSYSSPRAHTGQDNGHDHEREYGVPHNAHRLEERSVEWTTM